MRKEIPTLVGHSEVLQGTPIWFPLPKIVTTFENTKRT